MKKLLIILAMILPTIGMSQNNSFYNTAEMASGVNVFDEWKLYLSDCNGLVPDTLRQKGTVKCELVPVKMNGKIISYNQQPIDTVWSKYDCEEYKYPKKSGTFLRLTTGFVSDGYWQYSTPEFAKNTFTIKRNKICMIKKRKASFDDFFERWCVEKKLIKFN